MNTLSPQQKAQIEAYCEGRLSAAEAIRIAEQLTQHPDWMAYAESHRALLQGIDAAVERRFKATLRAHEAEQQRLAARRPAFAERRYLLWLALALLLALGLGAILWYNARLPRTAPPAEAFATHFAPPPNTWMVTTRGEADTAEAAQAMRLYDSGDYAAAAEALVSLTATEALFYLGVSRLQLGEYEAALLPLRAYRDERPDEADAHWYYALNLFALGKATEARAVLEARTWRGAAQARIDQLLRDLTRE